MEEQNKCYKFVLCALESVFTLSVSLVKEKCDNLKVSRIWGKLFKGEVFLVYKSKIQVQNY